MTIELKKYHNELEKINNKYAEVWNNILDLRVEKSKICDIVKAQARESMQFLITDKNIIKELVKELKQYQVK